MVMAHKAMDYNNHNSYYFNDLKYCVFLFNQSWLLLGFYQASLQTAGVQLGKVI